MNPMKVRIESITTESRYRDTEQVRVFVNGEKIGDFAYGSPEVPEDNMRGRDYKWIEPLLCKLAEKLGAEVEFEEVKEKDE